MIESYRENAWLFSCRHDECDLLVLLGLLTSFIADRLLFYSMNDSHMIASC